MSGKKRFQKPGSLQPNIDDILEWSKLPEDAFDPASSQEKLILSKIARVFPTGQMHGAVFAETSCNGCSGYYHCLGYFRICGTERGSLYL